MSLIPEERDTLIKALQEELDTRDKRFMFLKITFPAMLSYINMEGSANQTAWEIYSHFEKNNMLGSLMATLNSVFDKSLTLTT